MTTRFILTAALALVSAIATAQQPTNAGLRIVVVEGEDAVNIVQQKTAVAPVIEVRDRNNLPVPGALVTFSIQGGKAASFGGASTLTVATNAAGQAAVTGLTPTAAGAFQIQVSAAFQGQLATATIAQTNVMTAAQAAAASTAAGGTSGSSAGGGAGGGGLSTTTIVTTGAAIAGGAVAAVKIAENISFDENFEGPLTGQFVVTSINRSNGVTCALTWAANATVNLEIDDGRGDRSEGHFQSTGTARVVATTCRGAPPPDRMFNPGGTFTGTDAAMRGTETSPFSGSGPDGTFQGSTTSTFEGARSGDTITATIKFESRGTHTNPSGLTFDNVEVGSFQVTLRKTGDKKEGL
jgi:hypothetical protein